MPDSTLLRYDIKYVNIDITGSGSSVVVAGKVGFEIVGVNWLLVAPSGVVVRWRSGTTNIAGAINGGSLGAAPGEALGAGHFKCVSGEDLALNLDATVSVIGSVVVAFVPTS